jgi:hypothetical protein
MNAVAPLRVVAKAEMATAATVVDVNLIVTRCFRLVEELCVLGDGCEINLATDKMLLSVVS